MRLASYLMTSSPDLDLDGDGSIQPLTDGFLFSSLAAGACVTKGFVGAGATRTSCDEIEAFAGLTRNKISDNYFPKVANNKFSLTTAVDIKNPSAIIFRHAHDGPSALLGFAIWMFYDSSQQVAPQIVDDELSLLGISTSFVVNADSDDLDNNPATDRFASFYFLNSYGHSQSLSVLRLGSLRQILFRKSNVWDYEFTVDFGASITEAEIFPYIAALPVGTNCREPKLCGD